MILIDTDVFTLVHYGKRGVTDRVLAARDTGELGVPAAVRCEVLRGQVEAVLKAGTAADILKMQMRLANTEAFLGTFQIVAFDDAAAAHYDRIVRTKGLRDVGRGDLHIACIVLAHKATLVTRNTNDFALIPGMTVGKNLVNWAE